MFIKYFVTSTFVSTLLACGTATTTVNHRSAGSSSATPSESDEAQKSSSEVLEGLGLTPAAAPSASLKNQIDDIKSGAGLWDWYDHRVFCTIGYYYQWNGYWYQQWTNTSTMNSQTGSLYQSDNDWFNQRNYKMFFFSCI